MNTTQQRAALIFNEWARRYAENPDEFGAILDADRKPVEDYGQRCAIYFTEIAKDMDAKGLLPIPAGQLKERLRGHVNQRMDDCRALPLDNYYRDIAYGAVWAAATADAISDSERDALVAELHGKVPPSTSRLS